MKRFVFTLAVTALFAAAGVNAQVYQWKDENGKTIYSDKPQSELLASRRRFMRPPRRKLCNAEDAG